MNKLIKLIPIIFILILGVSCKQKEVKPLVDTLEFFWREAYLEDNKANFIAFDSIVKKAKGSYSYSQYNFEESGNKLISNKITYYYTYGQGVTSSNITKDTFNLEYSKLSTKQGGPFTQDGRSFTVIRVSKIPNIYTSFYQREMGRNNKYISVNNRK